MVNRLVGLETPLYTTTQLKIWAIIEANEM